MLKFTNINWYINYISLDDNEIVRDFKSKKSKHNTVIYDKSCKLGSWNWQNINILRGTLAEPEEIQT
jgi:hypothetical protein